MLLFDTKGLTFKAVLVDTTDVKLVLYTHESKELVLTASLKHPDGTVFFSTNEIHLVLFCNDKISLQALFDATAKDIVTVEENGEYKLYMRIDADIKLSGGEKLFSQFRNNDANNAPTGIVHAQNN